MNLTEIESKVKEALTKVEHPTFKENLFDLGMFGRVEEDGEQLRIIVKSPDEDRRVQIGLESQLRGVLGKVGIPGKFKIRFEYDPELQPEPLGNRIRGVKNVIAVGSGKGGVGKSTVTANLAAAMAQMGLKVGVLDADIYGPSIGKMFGFDGKLSLTGDGKNKISPPEKYGVKVMSFSFLLNPDQAVIWRGPMLGKAVEQFLYEIMWGELDFLLIDLPPGTGDVQLSLAQLIDLDGALVVTTPQNVAIQDATRAVAMFQEVKIPILGVVENMAEFVCPHCGKTSHIFSKNGGTAFAAKYRVPFLGSLPLQPDVMEAGESGKPASISDNADDAMRKSYTELAQKLAVEVEKYK
ncbi:MAG: Mrp/NBP35 family ATP-binding protein [Leptonema illini]|jgi:ATP-binding protein involved in chromosome partitioning|uniref:Iron-sulfur cluster carrier protein n=2 Tax=Leptonema illini TaxID=183 RepID=H2CGG0_9LEPT|nr:ATPase-like, ParA/MinD [Leptonema illini DSM 21528]KAB2934231.1 MAG: Mrp/NBP35 family ATP-binding protein [Leptonema illini]PKL30012.1 MAG: ATP-binding protein [Spirochaetae bacterium HGW-Spirochaetae-10]